MAARFLPNETIDGSTIIASVVLNDTDYDFDLWVILLLKPEAPHYQLVEVASDPYTNTVRTIHTIANYPNIVPAVEGFQANGGDY